MAWIETFLASVAPESRQFKLLMPFEADESRWYQLGVENEVFRFGQCVNECGRLRKWKRTGGDEFITPDGQSRHMFGFSKDDDKTCFLGREHVPHIAAVSRLIVEKGYDPKRYSFSRYRFYSRDLVSKKKGGRFETDAEFFGPGEAIFLQVEAKKTRSDVERMAAQIGTRKEFGALPENCKKELEYVLDLRPRYLWLVAPGLIEPEQFVYEVDIDDNNARFRRVESLPEAPRSIDLAT